MCFCDTPMDERYEQKLRFEPRSMEGVLGMQVAVDVLRTDGYSSRCNHWQGCVHVFVHVRVCVRTYTC